MRHFASLLEAAKEIERDLFEMGIEYQSDSWQHKRVKDDPDFYTKELISYTYRIEYPLELEIYQEIKKEIRDTLQYISPYYIQNKSHGIFNALRFMEKEAMNRILNTRRDFTYLIPELWNPLKNNNGEYDYTYSERIGENLLKSLKIIKENPGSRQALTLIFHPTDLEYAGGKKRIPCSIYYQLMRRGSTLFLIYNMRSCDFYKHWIIDTGIALFILLMAARALGDIEKIVFIHQINSFHIFRGDYKDRGIF